MNKGLLLTTRSLTGEFSGGLLCNTKIIEKEVDEFDLLTNLKTDSGLNHIRDAYKLPVNKNINLVAGVDFGKFETWEEVYDSIDVSPLQHYDKLFVFGGLHFPQSNLTRFTKRGETFPAKDKGQLKFQQFSSHMFSAMAIHKAHTTFGTPLHEFSYDCDEFNLGMMNVEKRVIENLYHNYHLYDMPRYGLKRLDSLQYWFQKKKTGIFFEKEDKIFDFTFGYTVYDYGNRSKFAEEVNRVAKKFQKINLYVNNKMTGESNSVPRDVYLKQIERSRYTYILPSYDNTCFSMYRFVESIQNDCLPIIHPDAEIAEAEASYDVNFAQLKTDEIFTETQRKDLLEYYKEKVCVFRQSFVI